MNLETQGKIITAILPKGKSLPVIEALNEKGCTRMNFAYARGYDIRDTPGQFDKPREEEKEILKVVAKDSREADELFALIFEVGEVNRLGGGILFMADLSHGTPFVLPDISLSSEKAKPQPAPASP